MDWMVTNLSSQTVEIDEPRLAYQPVIPPRKGGASEVDKIPALSCESPSTLIFLL